MRTAMLLSQAELLIRLLNDPYYSFPAWDDAVRATVEKLRELVGDRGSQP